MLVPALTDGEGPSDGHHASVSLASEAGTGFPAPSCRDCEVETQR